MDRSAKSAGQGSHRAAVETLQDRLVKEMRPSGNRQPRGRESLLGNALSPGVGRAFYGGTAQSTQCPSKAGARTSLGRNSERARSRKVADDHTVSWDGNRWGVPREEVCAGLRGAQVEIERRLDGAHWLRFRNRYLRLRHCPEPPARGKSFRPTASRTYHK